MTDSRKKISISTLLFRHSPRLLVFAVVIGAVAGALYSLIIPFVLQELNAKMTGIHSGKTMLAGVELVNQHYAALFFVVCCLILLTKAFSVIVVNNIAQSATAQLRLNVAKKINKMQIDHVESLGFSKLLNILIEDVNNVAMAAVAIPMVLVSTVTVIGMLVYLATLNFTVFLITLVAMIFGVLLFQVPVSMASGLYDRARSLRDAIQEGIRGLVLGAYELKLSREKSAAFIDMELVSPQMNSVALQKKGDAVLHLAGTSSDLLSFFIIGLIVFILPGYMQFPPSETYGVVMALLYLAGPVAGILGHMQQLQVGRVAMARIQSLDRFDEESLGAGTNVPLAPWREFRVEQVSYTYPAQGNDQDSGFALAPVSLSFQPGQINFIVGGNGSGKSTLSKLLSLHYQSETGGVYFDQQKIDAANLVQARARIAVIFSNYFLFHQLYLHGTGVDHAKVNRYLGALGLQGKTEFVDGKFTTTRLSDGQRRRLALLVALLEDKDIYIFDEWAADQDPGFKRVFYQDILPEMKRNNKLVIVITHDDRYFDCADRVIFMEDGKMTGQQDREHDVATASLAAPHSFLAVA